MREISGARSQQIMALAGTREGLLRVSCAAIFLYPFNKLLTRLQPKKAL